MVKQFASIRFWDNFFITASAIIFIAYCVFVYLYTINIPLADDFLAFNAFLVKFIESDSWVENCNLLFMQHYVHRIFSTRLVVLLIYLLTGKINYSAYIFIGHLFLVGIGVLLYKIIKIEKLKPVSLLIIISLIFNGQNFETSTWALLILANVGSLLLAFLSMYLLLSDNRSKFLSGLIFAVITIFSNGNGMFIIPVVICCLAVRKRLWNLSIFACIAGLCVAFFFYGYTAGGRISHTIPEILNNIDVLLGSFFIFIGNNLWLPSFKYISFIAGIICFSIYVWGVIKGMYKNELFCFSCLTFLYLSAAAVAYSGDQQLGLAFLRYRIYGCLIFILTCLLLINQDKFYRSTRLIRLLPVCAISLSLFSTAVYQQKTQQTWEWKKKSAYNWEHHIERLAAFSLPEATGYMKKTEQFGLYTMPLFPLSDYKSKINKCDRFIVNAQHDITYQIERIDASENYLLIEGYAFLNNQSMNQTSIELFLLDTNNKFKCIPFFERRYDVTNDINQVECGFFAVIEKNEITKGMYQIGIAVNRIFGSSFQVLTDTQITI